MQITIYFIFIRLQFSIYMYICAQIKNYVVFRQYDKIKVNLGPNHFSVYFQVLMFGQFSVLKLLPLAFLANSIPAAQMATVSYYSDVTQRSRRTAVT